MMTRNNLGDGDQEPSEKTTTTKGGLSAEGKDGASLTDRVEERLKRILDQTIQSYDSMTQISLELNLSLLPSIDSDHRSDKPSSLMIYDPLKSEDRLLNPNHHDHQDGDGDQPAAAAP